MGTQKKAFLRIVTKNSSIRLTSVVGCYQVRIRGGLHNIQLAHLRLNFPIFNIFRKKKKNRVELTPKFFKVPMGKVFSVFGARKKKYDKFVTGGGEQNPSKCVITRRCAPDGAVF